MNEHVGSSIESLSCRMVAIRENVWRRDHNRACLVIDQNAELYPHIDQTDGHETPNFPTNMRALNALSGEYPVVLLGLEALKYWKSWTACSFWWRSRTPQATFFPTPTITSITKNAMSNIPRAQSAIPPTNSTAKANLGLFKKHCELIGPAVIDNSTRTVEKQEGIPLQPASAEPYGDRVYHCTKLCRHFPLYDHYCHYLWMVVYLDTIKPYFCTVFWLALDGVVCMSVSFAAARMSRTGLGQLHGIVGVLSEALAT
ncbi:hypothetical protein CONLIGDRAFT_700622 [Coniochaeta ligniaria NRRL 30616]|uniref:Uncharacterized protein n=1 Tax=Coniochaeta ligniaria NRRL 30616 TaxID=1408157 RepID=A0A1J7JT79_9PEZI|nr:hypothetical protein CONLIGDRAFT_700622 [Coniochaeta ligniaria NRRL 30616]